MKTFASLLFCILATILVQAQVGINTSNPTATLDVVGNVKTDASLYLEDPGTTEIHDSKLLVLSSTQEIKKYDITTSKYGPLNYAQFVFRNLSADGLQDYDTKMSITDYTVTVQGYYFLEAVTGDTDIMAQSNTANDDIEGYQIYAYKNLVTETWFLRAYVNNSKFKTRIGGVFAPTLIDMYLNLVIYRNQFITKPQAPITVNMGNSATGIAPLPTGF